MSTTPARNPVPCTFEEWMKKRTYAFNPSGDELMREAWNAALESVRQEREAAEVLAKAVEKALADEESGSGWGPDVTVCNSLREALATWRAAKEGK